MANDTGEEISLTPTNGKIINGKIYLINNIFYALNSFIVEKFITSHE
jgi:hypothetical protein